MKIRKVCGNCRSEHVVKDAWAEWDMETQQWALNNVFDDGFCNDCEATTTIVDETGEEE